MINEEKIQNSFKGLSLFFIVIDIICLPIACLWALLSPMMSDGGLSFGIYVAIYFFLSLPIIFILIIAFSISYYRKKNFRRALIISASPFFMFAVVFFASQTNIFFQTIAEKIANLIIK